MPIYLGLDEDEVCVDNGMEAPCLLYLTEQTEFMLGSEWLLGGSVADHDHAMYYSRIVDRFADPELADFVGCQ